MTGSPAVTAVELVLPWPYKGLSPNARLNRYALAETKRSYRAACRIDSLKVRNTLNIDYPLAPPVTARVVFSVPKGALPDEDNCTASFKAGWDGIVDSKLLADDNPANLHSEVVVMRGARREVRVTLAGAS